MNEETLRHARQTVAAFAIGDDPMVLTVTGDDRRSWLNGLVTCDLAKAEDGSVTYGLTVEAKGKVVSDLFVVLDGARALLVLPRAAGQTVKESFERHLIMEDAEIADVSNAFLVFHLDGPRAMEVFQGLAAQSQAVGGVSNRTGLGGALVLLPHSASARASVEAAAQSVGGSFGDSQTWESLRLERGVPKFGSDFGESTYPQEAGLEKTAISFSKGCYFGQEVVCMLEMRGHVKRKLASLVFDGPVPPAPGSALTDGQGAGIGEVTSAAFSPTLGRAIGLGMVKRAFAVVGQKVAAGEASGSVVEAPL
jgi:folate-binding protein YgfZ